MRILHVNKFLYRRGGAEAYMLDLAGEQQAGGNEVEFYAMAHPDNVPATYQASFPSYVETGTVDQPAAERIRIVGRTIYSRSARAGIDAVAQAFKPDIAHLHNIYHQLSPSILRPLAKLNIPVVMTLHDYKLACPTYKFMAQDKVCEACIGGAFWNAPMKRCNKGSLGASALVAAETALHRWFRAYRTVDRFICPSEFLRSKMTQAGVYPDRMRTIPNFAPVQTVPLKDTPGGGAIYIGRLAPEKGVDTLIRAAALGEFELRIVGDGPERPALEALARETGARVRFEGHLGRDQVLELLRSSSVSVLAARWYENQPIAVIESFAAGVPVVASDIGGLPELVRPGETGALVPVDDSRMLADAVRAYIDDPTEGMEQGRKARAFAEDAFAPAVHLERIQQLYEEAIGGFRGQQVGA